MRTNMRLLFFVVVVVVIRVVVVIVAVVWMLMNHLSSFALSRKRPHVQIKPIQRMRFKWTDRRMDRRTDRQTDRQTDGQRTDKPL